MKKIAIIGAGEFQKPLIMKAKELGLQTHVFAWQEGAVGAQEADFFYPVDIRDKEKILNICREIEPAGVVTIASDLAAITAAYVAGEMGLTANTPACVLKTTNKYHMRKALKAAFISVPKFRAVDMTDYQSIIDQFEYPFIIKPTDRSGSRSIMRVGCEEDLYEAVKNAVQDSFENKALAEKFIYGKEYSMEAITYRGEHHFLALTEKFTTGAPNYIETGHMQPANVSDDVKNKVINEIYKALDALEIMFGASHAEFRIDEQGEIRIIEIGARMGGDCIGSHLVPYSTGYDFMKMVLDVSMGKAPEWETICQPKPVRIKFLLSQKDIDDFREIMKKTPEKILYKSEINVAKGQKVIDSQSRYGYYITS